MNKYFLYLFLFLIIFSCKKKKDDIPPNINILTPVNNQQFYALDTILITGIITDETGISSLNISLIDNNQKIYGKSISISINNDKSYNINFDYVMDDIHLESGKYNLEIAASDGINTNKKFIEIDIVSVPLDIKNIYVFCENLFNKTELYSLDNSLNKTYIAEYDFQLKDAETNSYYQQISMLTDQGIIYTYEADDFTPSWTASNLHLSTNPFHGILQYRDKFIFTSITSGQIYAYDNNGVKRKSASIESDNHAPGIFTKHTDYLFVADIPTIPVIPKIEKIYYETGYSMSSYEIDLDFVAMFYYDPENIIVWGNQNNIIKVCTLSVEYNVLYELDNFNQEKLYAVEKVNDNNYILSSGNNVYQYNTVNTTLNTVIPNLTADKILYNSFFNRIFIISDNSLFVYDYPGFNYIDKIDFQHNIIDVCFLFNKKN